MADIKEIEEPDAALPLPADLSDERLIHDQGLAGYAKAFGNRVRGGDLGSLPVVIGLVVILVGFYLKNPSFLSSFTMVSMMQFAAPVGIISLGIVVVLLVGEIDLSVGSVSGLAGAPMAVMLVYHHQSMLLSLVCGILVGTAIDAYWLEEQDRYVNPLGIKGIGEIGIVGVPAAIGNAVWHATGVRVRDLPIRLDKVLFR